MFLGSLISSPGPAHTRPASPLPCPGRLAMIVTEYMENGSLDAFLRVCLCPLGGRVLVLHCHPHRWGMFACRPHMEVQSGCSGFVSGTPHPTQAFISHMWGRDRYKGHLKGQVIKLLSSPLP